MFGPWTPLVALAASLLALLWLQRRVTYVLQELSVRWVNDADVALIIYFVVVLPGVVLHELSHWLVAKLLGVRVTFPKIGPVRKGRSNRVSLGSVRVGRVDPIRAGLIGVAPLLAGSGVILAIGFLVLGVGELADAASRYGLEGLLDGLEILVRVPDFWLWLYLIFAISNAMLPSESDMDAVRPVLIFLGIVTAVVLVVTGVRSIPRQVVASVSAVAGYLASSFGLTLAVDAVFGAVFGLTLLLTRWLQDDRRFRR